MNFMLNSVHECHFVKTAATLRLCLGLSGLKTKSNDLMSLTEVGRSLHTCMMRLSVLDDECSIVRLKADDYFSRLETFSER